MTAGPDEEYVEARRVLLDALSALGGHREAIVVVGAQAIYLRAGEGELPISAFTTDADLTLDPSRLEDEPDLEAALRDAGFEHVERNGAAEPGAWQVDGSVREISVKVPLDLIVPGGASRGRRGARLGVHGKRAARRSSGLEPALIDNEPISIAALDDVDPRSFTVRVAGLPALLVAKCHKIADRIDEGGRDRTSNKDASDVIRILQACPPGPMGATLSRLSGHPMAGPSTLTGIAYFQALFARRNGEGIRMATAALGPAMPEARVRALCLAYSERLARYLG